MLWLAVAEAPIGILIFNIPSSVRITFHSITTTSSLMRPSCLLIRRFKYHTSKFVQTRHLLTLAIETSCDDTSVAVLEKKKNNAAILHFHEKITSDNRSYGGVYPIVAHESHQENVASLVNRAMESLPFQELATATVDNALRVKS